MDRIQEEMDTLRDKVQDLEDNQCQCDSSEDGPEDWSDDEDEDE